MKILFTPVMKDGKQEVGIPESGEWIGDKSGYYPYNPDIEKNGFMYPIFTRTETNMKSPDEIKKKIDRLNSFVDNKDIIHGHNEMVDMLATIKALTWVLGEEGK